MSFNNKVINLSYILTTRNRLPFLKITLQKLLEKLQPDEEVVVVDGESTDGTQDYLDELFKQGKINQYVSEPDRNQAHGWNKAMLMAKGLIIKKIIDDDVFSYQSISKCKAYMLENPEVDVIISNDLRSRLNEYPNIQKSSRLPQFKRWRQGLVKSFTFSDVHMLIRRSSLAYIGLYNTSFTMMDWEYSLRISYSNARIVYYTGYNALNVEHLKTVTSKVGRELLEAEGKRGKTLYEYAGDDAEISYWSKIKIGIGNRLHTKAPERQLITGEETDLQLIYNHYYNHLDEINSLSGYNFLTA